MRKIIIIIILRSTISFGEENNIERFSSKIYLNNFHQSRLLDKSVVFKKINLPIKPMLASLVVPGLGQYMNKSPLWKTALFAGIEVAGVAGYITWTKRANDVTSEYEDWADEHWDMKRWVGESSSLLSAIQSGGYQSVNDVIVDGSHHITIIVDGFYKSSDILVENPNIEYLEIRDWDFYEGIGKYDQFVAGWDDASSDWKIIEKNIKDGDDELIVMTPNKRHYLDLRNDSNVLYRNAKFAISAIVFNHVFSALDALWNSNKNKELSYKLDVSKQLDDKFVIKGISVEWNL